MTEGDPKNSKDKPVSDFDMLVGGLKKLTRRAKKEGRIVPETPAIDRYVAKKKKQAGSPPGCIERLRIHIVYNFYLMYYNSHTSLILGVG